MWTWSFRRFQMRTFRNLTFPFVPDLSFLNWTERSATVFLMSRFESKKYHEIANELNISPKTVEVHISKALKHLRTALNGEWMVPCFLLLVNAFEI